MYAWQKFVSCQLIVSLCAWTVKSQVGSVLYSSPFQSTFAFSTPNLQQSFSSKLAGTRGSSALQQYFQQRQQQALSQPPTLGAYQQSQQLQQPPAALVYYNPQTNQIVQVENPQQQQQFQQNPQNQQYQTPALSQNFAYPQQQQQQPQQYFYVTANGLDNTNGQLLTAQQLQYVQQQQLQAASAQQNVQNTLTRQPQQFPNYQQSTRYNPQLIAALQQQQANLALVQQQFAQSQAIQQKSDRQSTDTSASTYQAQTFPTQAASTSNANKFVTVRDNRQSDDVNLPRSKLGVDYSDASTVSQVRVKKGKLQYEA